VARRVVARVEVEVGAWSVALWEVAVVAAAVEAEGKAVVPSALGEVLALGLVVKGVMVAPPLGGRPGPTLAVAALPPESRV